MPIYVLRFKPFDLQAFEGSYKQVIAFRKQYSKSNNTKCISLKRIK